MKSVAVPDPEEPVMTWLVTGCANCHQTIWRAAKRGPSPWRHLHGAPECYPPGKSS